MMNPILRSLLIPVLFVVTACTLQTAGLGPLPALQPGTARVVVYRDVGYYDSSGVLTVALNDQSSAAVGRGDVVYRDVAPGRYTVTFNPTADAPNQFKTVAVAAGDVVYVKLENFSQDNCGGSDGWSGGGCREIAYTSVIVDPAVAQREIKSLTLSRG